MTNAEKIRLSTDENLALFLDNFVDTCKGHVYCHMLGKNGDEHMGCYSNESRYDCIKCLTEWLEKEVNE